MANIVLRDDDGRYHCEDGPAFIKCNEEYWFIHGAFHREDGPAVINLASHQWYKNDIRHREDGPAIIRLLSGIEEWYINGDNIDIETFMSDYQLGHYSKWTNDAWILFRLRFL